MAAISIVEPNSGKILTFKITREDPTQRFDELADQFCDYFLSNHCKCQIMAWNESVLVIQVKTLTKKFANQLRERDWSSFWDQK